MIKEKRTADTKGEKAVVAGAHNAFPISYRIAHIRQDKSPITSPLPPPCQLLSNSSGHAGRNHDSSWKSEARKGPYQNSRRDEEKDDELSAPEDEI